MSVIQWWRDRLIARNPLYSSAFKPREDFKPRRDRLEDKWPHSVCRVVLYKDYCYWHQDVFLAPFKGVAFYDDFPEALPKLASEMVFYTAMSPLLYLVSRDVQVRNYLVPHRYMYEGKWVSGKRYRYFIRLCEWETHVAAFELYTGVSLIDKLAFFDVEKAKRMSMEIKEFKLKLLEESGRPEGA